MNHKGVSFALEVEPPSKGVVWVYDVGSSFHSHAAGSLQRLPNGNTLISEDVPGRVFEVTPNKEIVWEFTSGTRTSRAHRYRFNHCPELAKLSDH